MPQGQGQGQGQGRVTGSALGRTAPSAASLSGCRVLLSRSPDRAGAMARALQEAGAEVSLLPLIDFERAEDQIALRDAVRRAVAGEYDWMIISSITTVRALAEAVGATSTRAGESVGVGTLDGAGWHELIAAPVRLATIGPTSRDILERAGWRVDLAPEGRQSASGLLKVWTGRGERILIPQADIAGPGLADGLRAVGNSVDVVTAYRTVDHPARPGLRLTVGLAGTPAEQPAIAPSLTAGQAAEELRAGRLDAVVAASPSAARRLSETMGTLDGAAFVAIGESTAAEGRDLGISVAAIARTPSPDGVVEAVLEALGRTRSSDSGPPTEGKAGA